MMELVDTKVCFCEETQTRVIEYWYKSEIGSLRMHLTPVGISVHPRMFKISKTALKQFKRELTQIIKPVVEEWGFNSIVYHTNNEKFVNNITSGHYYKWPQQVNNMNIFFSITEELTEAWQTQ